MSAYYYDYSPVGDILVLATCIVLGVLIRTAYINVTRNFLLLKRMILMLFIASTVNIIYHMAIMHVGVVPNAVIYISRAVFHICLFAVQWIYVLYMKEPLRLDEKVNRKYFIIATLVFDAIILYEILGPILKIGYYIDADNNISTGFPIFPFGYLFYTCLLTFIMLRYRDRIFKPVMRGVLITIGVSFMIICIQKWFGQSSFTTATFIFPA